MKKVALITGASAGIGEETAKLMVQKGFTVYGVARRLEKMQALKQIGVHTLSMDLTDTASIKTTVQIILEREQRLDILVNNAGYGSYGALEDVPIEEARRQFEVNIFGLSLLIKLILPQMRAQKSGKIINISSIGGSFGEPHGSWYHATKYALEGLSDSLRMELMQFGIDVILIKPGAILTEWNSIAREKLLQVSGDTVYGELVQKHYKMLARADAQGSKPSLVAATIMKAALATKPKTRYAVGKGAKLLLWLHHKLPDRLFDRLLLSSMS